MFVTRKPLISRAEEGDGKSEEKRKLKVFKAVEVPILNLDKQQASKRRAMTERLRWHAQGTAFL